IFCFFFQAEDGIRDRNVTGVQTCALPICELIVLLLSTLIQLAHFSVQPILSLYVAEINGKANIAFFSGIAFSAAGLGNLLMTRRSEERRVGKDSRTQKATPLHKRKTKDRT